MGKIYTAVLLAFVTGFTLAERFYNSDAEMNILSYIAIIGFSLATLISLWSIRKGAK